jgi:hypothetical protein
METVTVELKDSNAMRLLKYLEVAKIIRILDKVEIPKNNQISASLRGSISKERANELLEQLTEMRNGL